MTTELSVVAVVDVKADKADKAAEIIRACVIETRKEPGCLSYTISRDRERSSRFIFTERWAGNDAFEAHVNTPHFLAMAEGLTPDLEAPLAVYKLDTFI
ncbi:antibiotic biosynthesis monooxygenase [Acetobacter sp. AN02]|uniref:putative quinol monooxygenase n=1 Tax=Acetobacter sp. AN02 TaxID=2894186 RepID=UPI002434354E|nr:putative quinol monooxygenase [Acetobacter sp. AN02]MDG6093605.1 antibiotic biosynthesis monooxygenase [Acetobacter sp. AN02]